MTMIARNKIRFYPSLFILLFLAIGGCSSEVTDAETPGGGTYSLTVTTFGSGTLSSNPSGINCGLDCSVTFQDGTNVTLSASAESGYTFLGWGGNCSGGGVCQISISGDHYVTATFVQSGGAGSDIFPYINLAAIVYGRTPDYSDEECIEISEKFDVMLGVSGSACNYRQIIKNNDPNDIILSYTNNSNCTEGDELCTYLENQSSPESYFLNFTANSVQDLGSSFSRSTGQRVCAYGWGCANSPNPGTRWTTDYVSQTSRDLLTSYFSNLANLPPNSDGWFFDNNDRGCSYAGTLVSGAIEFGVTGSISRSPILEEGCNRMKEAMDISLPANLYFIDNISNYGITYCDAYGWNICTDNGGALSKSYAEGVIVSRGTLQEYYYRITTTLTGFDDNYGGLKEIWESKGSPSNNMFIMWWNANGASGIGYNSDRVKLFALGTHLLYQFDKSYMRYNGLNLNNVPLQGDWFGAMGAPFGPATSDKTQLDSRTFRRDFDNAIVITRFRLLSSENYTDSANYNLGGSYYPLNADGSYSPAVTSITLRNAETFIGITNTSY